MTPAYGLQRVDAFTYKYTNQDGVSIEIIKKPEYWLKITMKYNMHPWFTFELWGDGSVNGDEIYSAVHESLNGKHIKDRLGNSRSFIFPNGTKLTVESTGWNHAASFVSIYDGKVSQHINVECFTLELSTNNGNITSSLEKKQADGETATIEIGSTGILLLNIYDEVTPGNKTESRLDLGEIYFDEPDQVTDLFDDPRWGHT